MDNNLTAQVRNIAEVTTAVARASLTQAARRGSRDADSGHANVPVGKGPVGPPCEKTGALFRHGWGGRCRGGGCGTRRTRRQDDVSDSLVFRVDHVLDGVRNPEHGES
jgi:hypothetical protein